MSNNTNQISEILNSTTPVVLVVCATILGVAGLFAPNITDSVRISFAGATATGFGAAAGLARSPKEKQSGVEQIQKAENVDVNL